MFLNLTTNYPIFLNFNICKTAGYFLQQAISLFGWQVKGDENGSFLTFPLLACHVCTCISISCGSTCRLIFIKKLLKR